MQYQTRIPRLSHSTIAQPFLLHPWGVIKIDIWVNVTHGLQTPGVEFAFTTRPKIHSLSQIIKGQLISKCPYEKSVSSKIPTKIFLEFCPEIFCSILRASWKLFGVPGDLVSNIINKEGYWKPKKLPGSPQKATKNFRSEIQKYFRWYVFWMKLIFHKDILKLSDL